jgi:ketosteroid isomerase-like protein
MRGLSLLKVQGAFVSRISRMSGSLLAVTALAVMFSRPRPAAYGQSKDEDQIRALEHRFCEAFKSKDVDGIMANYEHSPNLAFFDVVPRREYLGWDAYRRDWQSLFASIDSISSFQIKDLTITVDGATAYSYSFQHYLAKAKNGASRDVTVRVTDVYRKRGGKWLIVQEHVSVPVDLHTGKGDLQSEP